MEYKQTRQRSGRVATKRQRRHLDNRHMRYVHQQTNDREGASTKTAVSHIARSPRHESRGKDHARHQYIILLFPPLTFPPNRHFYLRRNRLSLLSHSPFLLLFSSFSMNSFLLRYSLLWFKFTPVSPHSSLPPVSIKPGSKSPRRAFPPFFLSSPCATLIYDDVCTLRAWVNVENQLVDQSANRSVKHHLHGKMITHQSHLIFNRRAVLVVKRYSNTHPAKHRGGVVREGGNPNGAERVVSTFLGSVVRKRE